MKRIIVFALVLLALAPFAMAQKTASILPNIVPHDARSMGMGGSFSATTWGFDSFYGNPAGFASSRGQLTIADASAWLYVKPTTANLNKLSAIAGGAAPETEAINFISDTITDNGFGGGMSAGLGWAGKGLGLGAFMVADSSAYGESALGTRLKTSATASIVIGFGLPLNIGDNFSLKVGADLRPTMRLEAANGGWTISDIMRSFSGGGDFLNTAMIVSGAGLAADAGAQLTIGALSVGLSLRDLLPPYPTKTQSLADFQANGIGQVSTSNPTAAMIPSVAAGVAWQPVLIKGLVDPGIYFEVQDPVSVIKNKESVWNLLHAGVDLRLLSLVTLRGGINRGWLSAGVGVNLWLVEANFAVFTDELGRHPGDQGRSGISFQASVHL